MLTVCEIVRKAETDYREGTTQISKYVRFNLRENIEKIEAYLNSKHITSDKDSKGRDKPFFNIVHAASNVWYRATDIDRKNIKIITKKPGQMLLAFLATVKLQEFLNRSGFGAFLNEWGRVLARYCSAITQFVEKDGNLIPSVLPWNSTIIDSIDFDNNVKIKRLELTEAQLRQNNSYDQELVNRLINSKTARKTVDGFQKDNKSEYITVYEVHGMLPLSLLTESEDDEKTFVQQMHVVSFIEVDEGYDDYTLFSSKEEDPLMISHLIKEDGRSQGIGAVERLFAAQWMVNHSIKAIKDQLDLSTKILFQTSDPSFLGKNSSRALDTGDILIHKPNEPLTHLANNANDIASALNFLNTWKTQGNETTGVSESMLGNTAPSGTAWRQVEALLQESHSLFELMTENKALALEEMMRRFVIPHIKKQLDTTEEIVATLDDYQMQEIDPIYIRSMAIKRHNDHVSKALMTGELTDSSIESEMMNVQNELKGTNKRFFKPSDIGSTTWKELFKDFEWDVTVDITGENSTSKEDVATLTTMLNSMANPAMATVLQTPDGRLVFNRLLQLTGAASPVELKGMPAMPSMSLPTNTQTQ